MPWKGERDPYKIWLSEIILQQTRVDQGLNYYKKFIEKFPDVHTLATAKEREVYKMWEGLGYYNRCRNLIDTARYVSKKRNGKFPETYNEILALKGVGNYTAAAITSFAYNLPYAVLDGNVFRVLSRVFGIRKPIDSSGGKKYFSKLAYELLHKTQPGVYNQALMDFGAVICKPVNPLCGQCFFQKHCYAYQKGAINKLPRKEKKVKISKRWFSYIVPECRGRVYIRLRTGEDIWKNLYEFVLIETLSQSTVETVLNKACEMSFLKEGAFAIRTVSPVYKQLLSHQVVSARFIHVKLNKPALIPGYKAISMRQLSLYAFPKIIKEFLRQTLNSSL